MALVTIQNLSFGYDSHAIVENLNFSVNTGEYLCIVGENGSGKTTFMKTLLHLQEPVSGLDPKVTSEMYDLVANLNREGITIIMISHDIAVAVRYASHILHIGATVFYGTREEYLECDVGKFFLMQQKGVRRDVR